MIFLLSFHCAYSSAPSTHHLNHQQNASDRLEEGDVKHSAEGGFLRALLGTSPTILLATAGLHAGVPGGVLWAPAHDSAALGAKEESY